MLAPCEIYSFYWRAFLFPKLFPRTRRLFGGPSSFGRMPMIRTITDTTTTTTVGTMVVAVTMVMVGRLGGEGIGTTIRMGDMRVAETIAGRIGLPEVGGVGVVVADNL